MKSNYLHLVLGANQRPRRRPRCDLDHDGHLSPDEYSHCSK